MAEHLAVLKSRYLKLVISGEKTIECRFGRMRSIPFSVVGVGDTIWFKESRGLVHCSASAGEVRFFENLTPAKIMEIKSQFNGEIQGDDNFWADRINCRYATLIWLEKVHQITPIEPKFRLAGPWLVLKGAKRLSGLESDEFDTRKI